ncbi:class I SAM-dependent methyltransferase [Halobacteriovorax sp. HLS]|uniref:class I SAM-dependent methyltransferase n=1 Tax=Halobacteriovorax sp. HLS TaxID=2234000 RepID=UPI000FDBED99|nr:class I SAM-dependent methyltransferase [Halobacteriovorax sp. HLS]
MAKLSLENKYKLYEASVQNHECDIDFINKEYRRIFGKLPMSLREDFGGTAAMACDWVKQSDNHIAWGVDLDSEPISYGIDNHYSKLNDAQKERMKYIEGNVLDNRDFKSDIVVAFNFSYFIFKERKTLLEYFKKVREGLNDEGAFFVDLFGGTDACQELVEESDHDSHTYFWDCESFNPITSEVLYYIHFEQDGHKYERVFTYDWRMWGLKELQDIMIDAGFSKVVTYWEGEDGDGGGDGNFYPSDKEENCESWVTYLCAIK